MYFSHVEEQLCVGYTFKVHFLKGQNTLKFSALWLASSNSCNLLGIGEDSDVRARNYLAALWWIKTSLHFGSSDVRM